MRRLLAVALLFGGPAASAAAPPVWCTSCDVLEQMEANFGDYARVPDLLVDVVPWQGCEGVDEAAIGTGRPATCSIQAALDYSSKVAASSLVDGRLLIGVTAAGDFLARRSCPGIGSDDGVIEGRGAGGAAAEALAVSNPIDTPLVLAFCGVELSAPAASPSVVSITGGQGPVSLVGALVRGRDGGADVGVSMAGARDVSLAVLEIGGFPDFAIFGREVTDLDLTRVSVTGPNGDSPSEDEGSVVLEDPRGTVRIGDSDIEGGLVDNVRIGVGEGALDLGIHRTRFGANSLDYGNAGLLVKASGRAEVRVSVTASRFTATRGDHLRLDASDQAKVRWAIRRNEFSNRHPRPLSGGGGTTFTVLGSPEVGYDISENTFVGALGDAIKVNKGSGRAEIAGWITANRVGVSGRTLSGSAEASGIQVKTTGSGSHFLSIRDNSLLQYSVSGISVLANDGDADLDVTVVGNTLAEPGASVYAGVVLHAGMLERDRFRICLSLGGDGKLANSLAIAGDKRDDDYRLTLGRGSRLALPGLDPATSNIAAYLESRNLGAAQGRVEVDAGQLLGAPQDGCRVPPESPAP